MNPSASCGLALVWHGGPRRCLGRRRDQDEWRIQALLFGSAAVLGYGLQAADDEHLRR